MHWLLLNFIFGFVCSIIFVANLSSQPRSSSSALGWLGIIFFFPLGGVALYLLFGGRKLKGIIQEKETLYANQKISCNNPNNLIERVLSVYHIPPTTQHNQISVIQSGEKAYHLLIDLIKQAQHSIEVQTYIVGNDAVGDAILSALADKANQGIKVRLLLDGLYAFIYPRKKLRMLKRAGVEISLFLPLRFRLFRSRVNLRNHRKLTIIDRKVAIMGGMNLAKEYMGPNECKDRWSDIAIHCQGDCIAQLAKLFVADWRFATKKSVNEDSDSNAQVVEPYSPNKSTSSEVQVVASGPDVKGDPFYGSLLVAIYNAKQSMQVVTPYFVPDMTLVKSLALAAFRGIEITIIIPRHSNHPFADLARSRHVRFLIGHGVKVLFFEPTMLHAKVITIDDNFAIVGSANFDMRSLFFNFESCLYFYSQPDVAAVKKWVEVIKTKCSDKRYLANPTWLRRVSENFATLISPLL